LNRKIRVLIVDDEALARKGVRVMIANDPEIEVIAECRSGREAVTVIREQTPDLVFLDIQMPEMDGFQVIEEVGAKQMPVTVFVTAFDEYALRAFEAQALDYLLKPFDHDRFDTALQRAKTQVRQQNLGEMSESILAVLTDMRPTPVESTLQGDNSKPPEPEVQGSIDRVVIKSGGRIYFLKVEEIDWVEGTGDYLSLHAGSQTHLIRETMGKFHAKLDSKKFLRIHRSTIVNIERIKDIQSVFKGEYIVTLTSGTRLNSSRGYRHQLQALLDQAR
jgi:two-component system LytT family response regulator